LSPHSSWGIYIICIFPFACCVACVVFDITRETSVIPESSRWSVCDKGGRIGIESMTKTGCSLMSGDATESITLAHANFLLLFSCQRPPGEPPLYLAFQWAPNHFCRFVVGAGKSHFQHSREFAFPPHSRNIMHRTRYLLLWTKITKLFPIDFVSDEK
jgi:hypothetical protein